MIHDEEKAMAMLRIVIYVLTEVVILLSLAVYAPK